MHRLLAVAALSLLGAASAVEQPAAGSADNAIRAARAEQAAAQAEAAKYEKVAEAARDEAGRLRAEEQAAAQAIDAAEARISASDGELRLASAYVAAHRRALAEQQQPISSLLAGLATMAERPPLLALADRGGTDELVKVRILLDSTLPVIRARTSKLSAQLAQGRRLEQAAVAARAELTRSKQELDGRRREFAALERRATERALASGGRSLSAGDTAIAAFEDVERLRNAEGSSREALRLADELAAAGPSPARPISPEPGRPLRAPFDYQLPAVARVTEGLGSVSASGVQSRGLSLAATRGAAVVAPAEGVVRFSGPFRDYDGILILDHGHGWMTLIVNVASPLTPGARVRLGDPVGRALGPLQVELSQNGQRVSPALIAGSSQSLSKARKGG
jgi:septal ring factor EnvC (AmiA/AmiB activator)